MGKIKIGLIGFGAWVRSAYLPALECDGRAVITAVAASSESTRQRARRLLGEDIAVFESYDALLREADADAVMIAVPDALHQPALTAALESGKAVFYEPPVSHLRAQLPVMAEKLLSAGQVTFAHLELGFHPAVARARQLIESGTIGLLQDITLTLHADWGCAENSDLGLINRMSCWYVDVLNRLAGSLPSQVLLLDGRGNAGRMQPVSTGIYKYDGFWGVFKADVVRPSELSIMIDISGSCGHIIVDYYNASLQWRTLTAPEPVVENISPAKPYADYPAVREAVSAFLDAAESGDASKGNAKKTAQLCMIGLAAETSGETGTWEPVRIL